jgi:hypothetical protein
VISLPVSKANLALAVGGTVVGVALGVASGVWESVLTTWYVEISGHVIRLPVAPILAVAGNFGIFWFTRTVTGKIGLALLPGLGWLAVLVPAGNLTGGGDLLVEGTWVGFATILLGIVAWAIAVYRAMLSAPRRILVNDPAPQPGATTSAILRGSRAGTGPTDPEPRPARSRPAARKPTPTKSAPSRPIAAQSGEAKPGAAEGPSGATKSGGPAVGAKPTKGKRD